MASRFSTYRLSLGLIWHDFKYLYTNFFHWNLSKIVIFLYAILSGIVLSIPFIGGIVYIGYTILSGAQENALGNFLINGVIDETLLQILTSHFWVILLATILFLTIIGIFSFTLTYTYVLLLNVYSRYLQGEKLPLFKNLFFSRVHLKKFLGVLGWTSLYILPPIAVALVVLGTLFTLTISGVLNPTTSQTHATILGGIAGVTFFVCFVWLVVRGIKLSFGYMYLINSKTLEASKTRDLVRASMLLAKWKILQILLLALPFVFVLSFLSGVFEFGRTSLEEKSLANQIDKIAQTKEIPFVDDHAFIKENLLNPFALTEIDKANILQINNFYNPKTDWVDREYLHAIMPYITLSPDFKSWMDYVRDYGFGIVEFLLINNALLMVYYSIFCILRSTEERKEA